MRWRVCGRVGDSGSIWWRRENDFDSLFPRRKAMRPAAASFLGEKFSDRTDYERKDDHPGRQMVNLIDWTSVPRIGNLVERDAKQHRRRIGCIMRVDFTFRSRDCLFFHFSATRAVSFRFTRPIDGKPAPRDNAVIEFQRRYLAMQRREIEISRSEKLLFFSTSGLSTILNDNHR